MKKLITAALLLSVLSLNTNAQDNEPTSEKVITKDISVSSFNSLEASGPYELRLRQANEESVKIEADQNMQKYFTVTSDDKKLSIKMEEKAGQTRRRNKVVVYVTFKNLNAIKLTMVGNVISDGTLKFSDLNFSNHSVGNVKLDLSADKLELNNHSVGNVELTGSAEALNLTNRSVGNVRAGDFIVQNMDVENSGVGNTELNAEKTLKLNDSSLGKVHNRGKAEVKKVKIVRA